MWCNLASTARWPTAYLSGAGQCAGWRQHASPHSSLQRLTTMQATAVACLTLHHGGLQHGPPCWPSPHNGPCHRDISFPPNPKPCKPCPSGVHIQGAGLRCLWHSLGRILSSRQSSAVHGQVVRQLSIIGWHIMLNPRCRLRQRHSQHLRCGALPVPCAPPEVFQCGRLGPPWCAAGVGC